MTTARRVLLGLCIVLGLPSATFGQVLQRCERIGGASRPDIIPATRHEVMIEAGSVRRIVLTLANDRRSTTDLVPMHGGVSIRLVTFPDPDDPARQTAVFNRAVVEPGSEVLVETWLRRPDAGQGPPAYNWYRLRCAPATGTK